MGRRKNENPSKYQKERRAEAVSLRIKNPIRDNWDRALQYITCKNKEYRNGGYQFLSYVSQIMFSLDELKTLYEMSKPEKHNILFKEEEGVNTKILTEGIQKILLRKIWAYVVNNPEDVLELINSNTEYDVIARSRKAIYLDNYVIDLDKIPEFRRYYTQKEILEIYDYISTPINYVRFYRMKGRATLYPIYNISPHKSNIGIDLEQHPELLPKLKYIISLLEDDGKGGYTTTNTQSTLGSLMHQICDITGIGYSKHSAETAIKSRVAKITNGSMKNTYRKIIRYKPVKLKMLNYLWSMGYKTEYLSTYNPLHADHYIKTSDYKEYFRNYYLATNILRDTDLIEGCKTKVVIPSLMAIVVADLGKVLYEPIMQQMLHINKDALLMVFNLSKNIKDIGYVKIHK